MECNADLSDGSLNIDQKIPKILSKYFVPRILYEKNGEFVEKIENFPRNPRPSINAGSRTPELQIPTRRRKVLSYQKGVPMENEKRKSVNSTILPVFSSSLFGILKFIRKRVLYRSYKNLKEHHFRIINDRAIVIKSSVSPAGPKKFHSIWDTMDASKISKKSRMANFLHLLGVQIKSQRLKGLASLKTKIAKRVPVLDPNHLPKILWDTFIFICLVLKLIAYSLDRAFVQVNSLEIFDGYFNFNKFLIIVLALDNLLTLNTKIYISGVCVHNRQKILWNYLKKCSFIDFLVALQLLLNIIEKDTTKFLDMNLLLLLKIIFCHSDLTTRLKGLLIKNNEYIEGVYNIVSLGFKILISGHVMACIWHLISYNYSQAHPEGSSWLREKGLLEAEWQTKYLYAIYWSVTTMLTVGYGDITPRNENEIVATIICMLTGCVMFGYSLNRIGEIVKMASKIHKKLKKHREQILNMASRLNLSKELQTKVTKYLEFVQDQELKVSPEVERNLMSKLSFSLRDEVLRETKVKDIKRVPFLGGILSEQSLLELARNALERRYMPEETIFSMDQRDDALYIVLEGEVTLSFQSPKGGRNLVFQSCGKNEFFGAEEFITGFPRAHFARTTKFTTLLSVKREDLLEVLGKNSAEYEKFCYARENIIVYNNLTLLNLKCSSCGRLEHKTPECPFLGYKPNKLTLIGRFILKKKKKHYSRRTSTKFNCLRNSRYVSNQLLEFRNNYEEETNEFSRLKQTNPLMDSSDAEYLLSSESRENITNEFSQEQINLEDTKLVRSTKSIKKLDSNLSADKIFEKKQTAYLKSLTYTRLKDDRFFLAMDKMKNFRYYFPRNNSFQVLRRLEPRFSISQIRTLKRDTVLGPHSYAKLKN